jgi:hypothetical protein
MEPTIIAIIISSGITLVGLAIGYKQWRRDVEIKLGQIRETVSVELIRQRIEPYTKFLEDLEIVSRAHEKEFEQDPQKLGAFLQILQHTIYGKIGLIASHETRLILLYVKSVCMDVMEGKARFGEFQLSLMALHLALRSDLGISQPQWSSEIERIRTDATQKQENSITNLVESYPWETLYPRNAETINAVKNKDRKLK